MSPSISVVKNMWQLRVKLSVFSVDFTALLLFAALIKLSLSYSSRVWLDQPSMKVNSTWVGDDGWGAASISFTIDTLESGVP